MPTTLTRSLAAAAFAGTALVVPAHAAAPTWARLALPAGVTQPGDLTASIDGRVVAFTALLHTTSGSRTRQVYAADVATGRVQLVSVDTAGAPSSGWYGSAPTVSPDGRLVAFATAAALQPDDRNGAPDVYVRDLAKRRTYRVSYDRAGREISNGFGAYSPLFGGRSELFFCALGDLTGTGMEQERIYALDLAHRRLSVAVVDEEGYAWKGVYFQDLPVRGAYAVSDDGRYIGVKGVSNAAGDVYYVYDRRTRRARILPWKRPDGTTTSEVGFYTIPSIAFSRGARRVAFVVAEHPERAAGTGDADSVSHTFDHLIVHDLATGRGVDVPRPAGQEAAIAVRGFNASGARVAFVLDHGRPVFDVTMNGQVLVPVTDAVDADAAHEAHAYSGNALEPVVAQLPGARYCPTSGCETEATYDLAWLAESRVAVITNLPLVSSDLNAAADVYVQR